MEVYFDPDSSTPNPIAAIYRAQHVCYAEGFSPDDNIPTIAADIIIKKQLQHGHYSVLEFATCMLHVKGAPHDAVMQMVRHQKNNHLVNSLRYSGKRFHDVTPDNVDEYFYFRPVGQYVDRQGGKYLYTEEQRNTDRLFCCESALYYAIRVGEGLSEEHARHFLPMNVKQNFVISCTIRSAFHWLDQRLLADTQLECRELANLCLDAYEQWCPELFGWYRSNRGGKNKLAP
jgi:thymidylate synthase (FAD)